MTKVYRFLVAVLAALGGALAMYLKGRNTGKKVEQAKTLEKEVKAEQAKNEVGEAVAEVRAEVAAMPDDDVVVRLRDKYQRD